MTDLTWTDLGLWLSFALACLLVAAVAWIADR